MGILSALFTTGATEHTTVADSVAANVKTSFVNAGDFELRDYYAAACPHCKHMDGAWKDAAGQNTTGVGMKQIECADANWNPVAENAQACTGIQGFPSVKMFKNDVEVGEYNGDRTAQSFLDYIGKTIATEGAGKEGEAFL